MTVNHEAALLEAGRVLARAGLSGVLKPCTSQGELLPALVVITPGIGKLAAIGFAHEATPREILHLDSPESGSDITLSE